MLYFLGQKKFEAHHTSSFHRKTIISTTYKEVIIYISKSLHEQARILHTANGHFAHNNEIMQDMWNPLFKIMPLTWDNTTFIQIYIPKMFLLLPYFYWQKNVDFIELWKCFILNMYIKTIPLWQYKAVHVIFHNSFQEANIWEIIRI